MAFLIMTVLPFLLISFCFNMILSNQSTLLEESYHTKTSAASLILNPMQILYTITQQDFEALVRIADDTPDRFLDEEYLDTLCDSLENHNSSLIIYRNGNVFYISNQQIYQKLNSLPGFSRYEPGTSGILFLDSSVPGLVKGKDFYFSDQSEGQIFMVTDLTRLLPRWERSVHELIFCLLLIIVITACLLILWIYNSIVRPMNILRIATRNIGAGHLDKPVPVNSTDEIGELCRDFEEMRIRLKEMINERMQYEQDTRIMISNMAHDLQTPITSIKGYAEGILDGVANTPEKEEKYIRTILSKATDMSYLIDELSVFAKVEQNTLPYHFLAIPLEEYFNDFLQDTMLDLETLHIRLDYTNSAARDTRILADPEQLKRVLNNIINNAVKYMDKEDGRIAITITDVPLPKPAAPLYRQLNKDGTEANPVKKPEEFVQIEIADNGPGIAAKDLPHIFHRFYRADASRNSSKRGSGLGLAIVERIIYDHGGKVWARSTPGQGTSIYITLKKATED